MVEKTYNAEKITSYLLGSLSAEEMERYDELSITDSAFADALAAAETDLVDAYVLGELANGTRRKFETYYLTTEGARTNVRFADALQQFGARNLSSTTIAAKSDLGPPAKTTWPGNVKSFFDFRPALQWGLVVVAAILLATAIWLTLQNRELRQQIAASEMRVNELAERQLTLEQQIKQNESLIAQGQETVPLDGKVQPADGQRAPSILSLTLLPPVRGAQQAPSVSVTSATTALAVRLELEPNEFSSYRVTLLQQDRPLWRSGNLRSQSLQNGPYVSIKIPATLLKPGGFVLRVSGLNKFSASDVIGDYAFQVK